MKQIFLSILFCSPVIFADQPNCTSGKPEQNNLVTQLDKAKADSEITKIIYKNYQLGEVKTEAQIKGACDDCGPAQVIGAQTAAAAIGAIPTTTPQTPKAPQLAFKPECLRLSDQFSSAETSEYSCPDGRKSRQRKMCITEDILTYQNAAISNIASCMSTLGFSSMNIKSIFQKFSIESTFKPQYASLSGVGIGQLTNIFVADIHQAGRGLDSLKMVAESTNPECEAAKMIAQKDLRKKPNLNIRCQFTAMGEGMERNILYSMIGTNTLWEKDLEPAMRRYLNKYSNHPDIAEAKRLALMNAYGAGGPAGAQATVRRLASVTPDKFVKLIKKPMYNKDGLNLTQYTSNIENRQKEIAKLMPAELRAQYAEKGSEACINRF